MSKDAAAGNQKGTVFVRDATGLVRGIGPWDSLYMNVIGIAAVFSIVPLLAVASSIYPGANLFLAFTIALVVAIPFGWCFAVLTAAFPRAGGDYVYNSRIIHPAYGFVGNMIYTMVNVIALGLYGGLISSYYLSSVLSSFGTVYNNASLTSAGTFLSTHTGVAIVGTILVVWAFATTIFGMRPYLWTLKVLFWVAVIGTIVLIGVMATSTNAGFITSFNAVAAKYGTSYTGIVSSATKAGYSSPGFSIGATLLSTVFIYEYLTTAWPTQTAGELKSANKSLIFSILGGIGISYVLFMLITALYDNVFGASFTNAITWLATNQPSSYPLPASPYLLYLVSFLSNNPIVLVLVSACLIAWGIGLLPNFFMIITRPLFAYSFDRIIPSKFASVSDRTHTPVFSMVVILILAEIALLIENYAGSLIGAFVNVAVWIVVYFIFTMITAVVFPFIKKDLFQSKTGFIKAKLGPVPIITIAGVVALIGFADALITYLQYPALSGPVTVASNSFFIGFLILVTLLYFGSYWYRKQREGIDISLNFKVIPPE
jgi:APA family basic amino acid/polyamine antiporter